MSMGNTNMQNMTNSLADGNIEMENVIITSAEEAASSVETPENPLFSSIVDFSQLDNMTKEEQLTWLESQMTAMTEQGKACPGFEAAVTMDIVGLDMSRVKEDGSYTIPLQSMLYAEGVNLGIVDPATGAPNMEKLKELSVSGLEGTDADSIFKLNKLAVDFCNKDGVELTDGTTSGKDVLAMFSAMDEQSDFDWVQNPAQAMAEGNPNVYAGLNAISMATNPNSPASDYSVTLDKNSMDQAHAYLKMKEAIENGTFSADMAKDQFAVMNGSYEASQNQNLESSWNFMEHLDDGGYGFLRGAVMGSYLQKDENGGIWPWSQSESTFEAQANGQVEAENGQEVWSFGPFHRNGEGIVIDLPGSNDLHLGKTEENQANGTLFGFVGTALDGVGYENPKNVTADLGQPIAADSLPYDTADIRMQWDKDGNLIDSKGLSDDYLQTLESLGMTGQVEPMVNPSIVAVQGAVKGVNTAKPGERGQQAEEMFAAVNEKAALTQASQQLEEM